MEYSQFHFANNYWFLGLLVIPVIWLLYSLYYQSNANIKDLENFADKHLIPHLLRNSRTGQISIWRSLALGSVLWVCLMAAMAGPRWDFKEVGSYKEDQTLLILLDLSKSMDANDISPSRLIRARQEIEDIITISKRVKIGLVGFAADAHIVAPITDDMNNIRHLLPLLGTDLVFVQGTRIVPALKTAKQMLLAEPGHNKSILIITDGGFQDQDGLSMAAELASNGIIIHTLGIASKEGVNFADLEGAKIKRNDQVVISRLEKEKLKELSSAGSGQYFDTHYSNKNARKLLQLVEDRTSGEGERYQNIKHWDERFYIFVFPLLLIILLWFRKGFTFPIILLILLTPAYQAQAQNNIDRLFLNKEQFAKKAFEEIEDIDTALSTFEDPYKRGVAYYKAGKFKQAEQSFRQNTRPEVKESALYNLANSLAYQDKLAEAVSTYNQLLSENPNHEKAKHNRDIVQTMIASVEEDKEERKKDNPSNDGDLLGGGGGGGDDADDDSEGGGGGDKDDDGSGSDDDNSNEGDDEDNKNSDTDKNNEDDSGGDDGSENGGDPKDKDGDIDNKNPNADKDNDGDESDNRDNGDNNAANSKEEDGNDDSSPTDAEIDQLLDLISNNHKNFLQNQFYIESYKNNTQPTSDPW